MSSSMRSWESILFPSAEDCTKAPLALCTGCLPFLRSHFSLPAAASTEAAEAEVAGEAVTFIRRNLNVASFPESDATDAEPLCCACQGALQHMGRTCAEIRDAVHRSPFLDADEIGFTTLVPRNLSLVWLCAAAVYVERLHRAAFRDMRSTIESAAAADTPSAASAATSPPAAPLTHFQAAVTLAVKSIRDPSRLNAVREDLHGNLRNYVVADVRNFGLDALYPPRVGADASVDDKVFAPVADQWLRPELRSNAEDPVVALSSPAQEQQQPSNSGRRWRYSPVGTGQGIFVEILFTHGASADVINNLPVQFVVNDKATRGSAGGQVPWSVLRDAVAPAAGRAGLGVTPVRVAIDVRHEPLFLLGRYRKYSRSMPQSPWFAKGKRISASLSLQEEIVNPLLHLFFPLPATTATSCVVPGPTAADRMQYVQDINHAASLTDGRIATSKQRLQMHDQLHGALGGVVPDAGDAFVRACEARNDERRAESRKDVQAMRAGDRRVRDETIAEALKNLSPQQAAVAGDEPAVASRTDEGEISTTEDVVAASSSGAAAPKKGEGASAHVTDHMRVFSSQVYGFSLYKFHTGGREDVDVRMLGAGRPFVIEILTPHRQRFTAADLAEMARIVNASSTGGAAEIEALQLAPRSVIMDLAKQADSKRKHYRCVVFSKRPMLSDSDPYLVAANARTQRSAAGERAAPFIIQQVTPIRVLHRRTSMARPKRIYHMQLRRVNAHWLMVDLTTQAGTYIKEFCHGDMGRTRPSLADLLNSTYVDIIQLDVAGMTLFHADGSTQVAREVGDGEKFLLQGSSSDSDDAAHGGNGDVSDDE